MLVYHPPPPKPKFVRIGRFIYMLRTIYLISKTSLLLKQSENKTFAYLLSTSAFIRNCRAPEPEDGSIILNDINSLIEYSLEFYKLVEGIEYKINILSNLYHNIENDKQLLNYNGSVLFVKVTETAQHFELECKPSKACKDNGYDTTTNKECTKDDINAVGVSNSTGRDWNNNNNGVNLSTTDNGYINSTIIIHQKNNIFNSSNTNNGESISQGGKLLKKSASAKSYEVSPNYVDVNFNNPHLDNIRHKPRLLIKTKQVHPNSGNNKESTNSGVMRNHNKVIISNIPASADANKSKKAFYVKASFYPQMLDVPPSANSIMKTQKRNQSSVSGYECYDNYSSGNISANNNQLINEYSNNGEGMLCDNNDMNIITSKRNTLNKFNNKHIYNKNSRSMNVHPKVMHYKQIQYEGNSDDYKEETNMNTALSSTTGKENQSTNTNNGFIATKLFPIRGHLHLHKPFLKKSSSLPLLPKSTFSPYHNNEQPPFLLKPHIHIHGSDIELNDEDKIQFVKTFLLSKHNSPSHYPSPSFSHKIKEHINENIKNEYTEFLLELRQCVLRNIHNIITDSVISNSPNMSSTLQYIKTYQSSFPFKQCIKEFILYSYISSHCSCNSNEIYNNAYGDDSTKPLDKNEILNSIRNMKIHLDKLITDSNNNNPTDILTYCRNNKNEIVINTSFFEIFILCADYFNGYQHSISKLILQILGIGMPCVSYEHFSSYYLHFRCFDLVTNEQKFQFIKKLVNLLSNQALPSTNLLNIQIELRNILDIDEYTLSIFDSAMLRNSKMDLSRRYTKIDIIYLKLINYFTYQH